MRKVILSALMVFSCLQAGAQQAWTLPQCVDYALQHNISLKKIANQNEQKALQVSTAKNARLPNLNASVSENISFGRGLTADNTYTNRSTASTQLGLYTSVPIFTGMKLPNQLKLARLNLEAATADLEKARNDVSLRVAEYYMSAVYDRELLDVARRQIAIDSMQVARLKELLRHGKAAPAEVSQQEATLAQSHLTATNAANDLHIALLNLSQLLELPSPEGFNVQAPSIEDVKPLDAFVSPDIIYAEALGIKPEIAAEELRLKGAEYNIKIAQAGLYPTLDFSGSVGSNYYTTSGMSAEGFGKQIKNNFSQGIGLQLNIPLFNRFATRNNIRSAQIERVNQQLTLDETRKNLYKEIQQVYYNTLATCSTYKSSIAAVQSAEDAFELMRAKYEAGKSTVTEFDDAKNKLLKAHSDLIRAKYQYLYQMALMDFYRGKPLTIRNQ